MEKLVGWDKGSLTRKAKAARGHKAKIGIYSLVSVHNPGSKASPVTAVALGIPAVFCNHTCHPPSSFSPVFIAEHDIMWYRISLWTLRISCPGSFHSQILAHLIFGSSGCCWRDSLDAMQALLSNSQNTVVTNAKHITVQVIMRKVNSTPSRPSAHTCSFFHSIFWVST